jgi:uncharacterized protein (TIGR00290 family)
MAFFIKDDMEKIILAWSGGKDSAFALYELRKGGQYEVVGLMTTITRDYDRVSMHGIRTPLIEQQAKNAGLPLIKVFISAQSSNEEYAAAMTRVLNQLKTRDIQKVAFGDIFLEDVRSYREKNLALVGMTAVLPLWGKDSKKLAEEFIRLGFKAIVSTCDPKKISSEFCGRVIDNGFITALPQNVDPAGENGEFHSFAFDGPIFKQPVRFTVGEKVLRDGFWFCDLVPL